MAFTLPISNTFSLQTSQQKQGEGVVSKDCRSWRLSTFVTALIISQNVFFPQRHS